LQVLYSILHAELVILSCAQPFKGWLHAVFSV